MLFRQIHDIVFHGRGGYDYRIVYEMPIWLRRFTIKAIEHSIKEEVEASKTQPQNMLDLEHPEKHQELKRPDYVMRGARK